MKTKIKILVMSGLSMAAVFTSCQKDNLNAENVQYASLLNVSSDGTSTIITPNMQSAFVETQDLNDAELASLLKMKEEEKLACDIYSALYQKWGSTIFNRIAAAENNHLNAIIRLLEYYGSPDTLAGEAGIFTDANVQILYNELLSRGSASVEEAYKAGALIEEMDIKDLSDALGTISNPNIVMVYENLVRGSRNHLRSFYKQLTSLGFDYTPIYITQAEFDQIVTSSIEKGKQYKMKGKGYGNRDGFGQGKRKG